MSRLEHLERVAAINGTQADTYRDLCDQLRAENAKLRELVRGLHMAYIGIIGKCEGFDSSLTWEFSSDIDAALAKQHASYEQDRHRFDVAMRELGVIETEVRDEQQTTES